MTGTGSHSPVPSTAREETVAARASPTVFRKAARDARLVPIALGAWATALLGIHAPAVSALVSGGLWLAALACLGATVSRRAGRGRGPLALVAVALSLAAAVGTHAVLAEPARSAAATLGFDGGRAIEVHATVTTKVAPSASGDLRFEADAAAVVIGGERTAVAVPVSIAVAPAAVDGHLDLGSVVVARGTAERADAGRRPVMVVYASRGVEVTKPPVGAFAVAAALRTAFIANVDGLPGPGAGLLPGLAVGDTSAVSAELDDAMKASSLSHLTAVSGANCALVVGIAFGAAAGFGARRWVRVLVSLAALAGFIVLVTPEASVIRAGAMATIAMLAVLLGRRTHGLSVLCLAVTALLVADPWLSASLGFALSAAATGALLVLAPPLARGLQRWMPRAVALALAVPLAAQLACGPLIVLISPTVSAYGVLANIVAGPAAPAATVIGLAACLSAPFPWLAQGLAAIAWLPSAWIAATALTVAHFPSALVPWLEGWWGLAALTAIGAALTVLVVRAGRTGRCDRIFRMLSGAAVAVVLGAALGGAAVRGVASTLTVPRDWSIVACDVGQGDAVLVRSSGAIALVDTGPDPGALTACLARFGVGHIDLLVLTHFDLDHVGGLDAVVGRVGVALHGPVAEPAHRRDLTRLASGGAQVVAASAGMRGALADSQWRVLWPRATGHAFRAGNDASVVVEFTGGGVPRSILLGDLSAAAQRALMGTDAVIPPYDVVKVAHHGSADQDADLYARLRPAVAVVTVGTDNDYGHPRDSILDTLDEVGAVTARTDEDGAVVISTEPDGVRVWRERGGTGDANDSGDPAESSDVGARR